MSATSVLEPTSHSTERPLTAGVVTNQMAVLRSEWTKFRSLRSTMITLGVSVLILVGAGAAASAVIANKYPSMTFAEKLSYRPIFTSLQGGLFAQLTIGVLGVMMMTSEYSTGMIRSTFTVVPRRLPVLWAKLTIFISVVGVVSLISAFGSFFLGEALLGHAGIGVSITSTHALRDVIGEALYLTTAGVIGIAIGALLRSTAGGITTFVAGIFVLPPILDLLPTDWTNHIAPYLPAAAGAAVWSGNPDATSTQLAPWLGYGVMCLWAVALIAAATIRLSRSDA